MYKDPWTLVWRKKIKSNQKAKKRSEKFVVPIMKNDCLIGRLPKEKTGKIAKIVFYLLHVGDGSICLLEMTSKSITQGGGKGMKIQ